MTASGSLFEYLFEVVDCGGHHEFAELAVSYARVDSGAESTLDGRKRRSRPSSAGRITRCPTVRCAHDRTQRTADDAARAGRSLTGGCPGAFGRHSPCHRQDSRFSRCYEERLEGQFVCLAASVPSSEHRGWYTSLYRRAPSFWACVCGDPGGVGSVLIPFRGQRMWRRWHHASPDRKSS